jgi:threo-3-hydroxy-L-aspartate ammonia-lyase
VEPVALDIDDIHRAASRLEGIAHRTPVLTSRTLDDTVGAQIHLKGEHLQRAGAFKFRGAYNKVATLPDDDRRRGVAAYSSGNHAQAVALAARMHDTTAVILMPEDTPPNKLDATRGYGAEIVFYDRYTEDRDALGRHLAEDRELTLIPPYDDPLVMAGQGTAALELVQDTGPLDVFLAPMSGGGLMAGCATAVRALYPDATIIGVEPATADDTRRSLEAGQRVRIPVGDTIADGLQADIPGELTFPINQQLVDQVVTVDDDAILYTMVFLFERMKAVVEPSGAVAVAALLAGSVDVEDARVAAILSGGNIAVARLADLHRGRGLPAGKTGEPG